MTKQVDVIIIGAGFSGISAGLHLKKNNISSLILEARTRVGGRTKTDYLANGTQIDIGGQWIGPTQDRMYELVKEYNVETFPTQLFGEEQYLFNGKLQTHEPDYVSNLYNKLDELAKTVNLEHPEETEHAEEFDRITFATWLDQNADSPEVARLVGRILAGGLLSVDAGEISLLQMLLYIASGQGIQSLISAKGGAQQDRLIGGPQSLAIKMLEDYGVENVFMGHSVSKIDYTNETVKVYAGDSIFYSKKVIIAAPPSVVSRKITFEPELPILKQKMLQNMIPGSASKYHVVYDKPFWREEGICGRSNTSQGYIVETVDNSLPNAEQGIITFFVYGNDSIKIKSVSPEKRKEILLEELAVLYGSKALQPVDFIEYDWDEKVYTGGCFTGHFPPFGILKYGEQLRKTVGPLHFAGTETSTIWTGYFEGAVRAGEREAQRIVEVLSSNDNSQNASKLSLVLKLN